MKRNRISLQRQSLVCCHNESWTNTAAICVLNEHFIWWCFILLLIRFECTHIRLWDLVELSWAAAAAAVQAVTVALYSPFRTHRTFTQCVHCTLHTQHRSPFIPTPVMRMECSAHIYWIMVVLTPDACIDSMQWCEQLREFVAILTYTVLTWPTILNHFKFLKNSCNDEEVNRNLAWKRLFLNIFFCYLFRKEIWGVNLVFVLFENIY